MYNSLHRVKYLGCILKYQIASSVSEGVGGWGVMVRLCNLSPTYFTLKIFYLKLELSFIMLHNDFCCVFLHLYVR